MAGLTTSIQSRINLLPGKCNNDTLRAQTREMLVRSKMLKVPEKIRFNYLLGEETKRKFRTDCYACMSET